MQSTEALEARIQERVFRLEKFSDKIISCRVTVEQLGRHHHQGRPFSLRINLRLPGTAIEIEQEHEDFQVALRDAFQAATRKLEEALGKRADSRPAIKEPVDVGLNGTLSDG
jgi:ribosomal subunit interface protein